MMCRQFFIQANRLSRILNVETVDLFAYTIMRLSKYAVWLFTRFAWVSRQFNLCLCVLTFCQAEISTYSVLLSVFTVCVFRQCQSVYTIFPATYRTIRTVYVGVWEICLAILNIWLCIA